MKHQTDRPVALLLDLDNTVYPYDPAHRAGLEACWETRARATGLWESLGELLDHYARARRRVIDRIPGQAAARSRLLYFHLMLEDLCGYSRPGLALELDSAYWEGFLKVIRPDPHCLTTLTLAKDAGIRMAWVSNLTTGIQVRKLQVLGLESLAHFLVTSEEAGAEKPATPMLELALTKLGVTASQAWMVGDNLRHDIQAANNLGMRSVWMHRAGSLHSRAENSGVDIDLETDSWEGLARLLGLGAA